VTFLIQSAIPCTNRQQLELVKPGASHTVHGSGPMMPGDQAPNGALPQPYETREAAPLRSALSTMAEVAADEAILIPPSSSSFPSAASLQSGSDVNGGLHYLAEITLEPCF